MLNMNNEPVIGDLVGEVDEIRVRWAELVGGEDAELQRREEAAYQFTGPVGIPIGRGNRMEQERQRMEQQLRNLQEELRILQEEQRQRTMWRFSGLAALAGLAAIPTYNMYKQYSETRKAKQVESHVHREQEPTVHQLQIT